MITYGSFGEFENQLYRLEQDSFHVPITIGILICDASDDDDITQRMLKDMADFNKVSSDYINFYIPGYCTEEQMKSYEQREGAERLYEVKWKKHYFSSCLFENFIERLGEKNIIYKNEPELLLVEVEKGRIHWDKRMHFPLRSLEREGKIASVKVFFEDIFRDATKYVDICEFSKQGKKRIIKKSVINYLKDKLPREILLLCEIVEGQKVFQINEN